MKLQSVTIFPSSGMRVLHVSYGDNVTMEWSFNNEDFKPSSLSLFAYEILILRVDNIYDLRNVEDLRRFLTPAARGMYLDKIKAYYSYENKTFKLILNDIQKTNEICLQTTDGNDTLNNNITLQLTG